MTRLGDEDPHDHDLVQRTVPQIVWHLWFDASRHAWQLVDVSLLEERANGRCGWLGCGRGRGHWGRRSDLGDRSDRHRARDRDRRRRRGQCVGLGRGVRRHSRSSGEEARHHSIRRHAAARRLSRPSSAQGPPSRPSSAPGRPSRLLSARERPARPSVAPERRSPPLMCLPAPARHSAASLHAQARPPV